MKKKIVALMIAIIMIAAVLASCGGSGSSGMTLSDVRNDVKKRADYVQQNDYYHSGKYEILSMSYNGDEVIVPVKYHDSSNVSFTIANYHYYKNSDGYYTYGYSD